MNNNDLDTFLEYSTQFKILKFILEKQVFKST